MGHFSNPSGMILKTKWSLPQVELYSCYFLKILFWLPAWDYYFFQTDKLYLRFVSRSHTAFTNVGMHFIMYCLSAGPDFLASLSGLARDPETTQNNREGINEQELSGFFFFFPNLPHKNISEINT